MRIFTLFFAACLPAQEPRRETIVVTATYEPLALEEIDRSVTVLPARDLALVSNTLVDLLRLDSSLDLRQRAPNGLQSDLSIRGSTFGQTLVLLNGQRLNDAQSGHHNMDIPTPLEAVSRIEVLRGAGSTFYGSDAIGGAINILTEPPELPEIRLRAAAGSHGVNQQRGSVAFHLGELREHLTFSRDFSSGFRPNRDYRNLSLASSTYYRSTTAILAWNDRPFGADRFYGNFNSWEDTKTWFASLRQGLGAKTQAGFAWRRHSDLFVLYRDRPQVFANHHASETWQASLRRREPLGKTATLYFGGEGYQDSIRSNNLGRHARGRAAAYGSLDLRALRRFSLSLGAREEVYGSLASQLSPSLAAGVWLTSRVKVRGSVSRAFRVPTYTDLYYHDPANLGSPDLRPERAWSQEAGIDWNSGGVFRAAATLFHRREQDVIDYIRRSPSDIWRATNVHRIRFTGIEATAGVRAGRSQQLDFRYTGLNGAQNAIPGVLSKYVFNYPSHSGVASWHGTLAKGLLARTRVGALNRRARDPYALWDIYLASTRGRFRPFAQFTNLTATVYEEIPGVVMPGRAVVGGIEILLQRR